MREYLQKAHRSVDDMSSRNSLSDADAELVRRYVSEYLTEEERTMIETRIVADPAFRSEIELAEAMRDGLHHLAAHGQLAPLLSPSPSFLNRPVVALAASFAAIAFAVTSVHFYTRFDQTQEEVRAAAVFAPTVARETLRFEMTRSAGTTPNVIWDRPTTPTLVELQLDVGLEPAANYTVSIELLSKDIVTPILVLPNVAPESHGLVLITVHSALLERGDYRIRLEPHFDATIGVEPRDYSLRILD